MARKRYTPPDDIERFAENLWNNAGGAVNVKDRDSYDAFFNKYMDDTFTPKQDRTLRDEAFKVLNRKYDVPDEKLFSDARGKNLLMDKKKNAKKVVATKEEYKKEGAKNVDLAGYDTSTKFDQKGYQKVKVDGKIRRRVVFVRSDRVKVKEKWQTRYRDRKGRFVSVKQVK